MTADLKRQLSIGQGSMADRLRDYVDPFEPEQPKPAAIADDELVAIIATWMRSDD